MARSSNMHMDAGGGLTGGLLKDGYKHFSGLEQAVLKNAEACKKLSSLICSSMGPQGMNKMVINHLDKLFVTSDAATIVGELEVAHPAAKMVVMAAKMQEQEIGDGTNFVVSFAGELMSTADSLLRMGVHPSDVVAGFKQSTEFVLKEIDNIVCHTVKDIRSEAELTVAVKPVIASHQYGYEDVLAPLVAKACKCVIPNTGDRPRLNMDSVRVAKMIGGNITQSEVVEGYLIMRDAQGIVKSVGGDGTPIKIAVFGCAVSAAQTETKGTVLIESAEDMLNYNLTEERQIEANIKAIAESGAKVVVSGGSISEMAQHFLDKYGLLTVKIISKFELRRLCRAIGATAVVRLGSVMEEEMGTADTVRVEEFGGRKCLVFRNSDVSRCALATIILRSSTRNQLDDMERCINDGVNTIKAVCKDPRFVPGAGAVELALAARVAKIGEKTSGLEQYAIMKYAESLEVVARTLADNSGQDAQEVISKMYAANEEGKTTMGVNIEEKGVLDCNADDVKIIDHLEMKKLALRLSSDAAITVLRVDQIIMSKPAGGPKQ